MSTVLHQGHVAVAAAAGNGSFKVPEGSDLPVDGAATNRVRVPDADRAHPMGIAESTGVDSVVEGTPKLVELGPGRRRPTFRKAPGQPGVRSQLAEFLPHAYIGPKAPSTREPRGTSYEQMGLMPRPAQRGRKPRRLQESRSPGPGRYDCSRRLRDRRRPFGPS